jgi:hypothetical protein
MPPPAQRASLIRRLRRRRPLSFFAYGVGEVQGRAAPWSTHAAMLQALKRVGFPGSAVQPSRLGCRCAGDRPTPTWVRSAMAIRN